MRFVFDDGGRAAAGYRGRTGDCTCRAIAIAAEIPYQTIYDLLNEQTATQRITKRQPRRDSARSGIYRPTIRQVLDGMGWTWTPTMKFGSGCTVHLRANELPRGRLILSVSRHVVAVIDGVIHDTHDPSRGGTRCVYGYWKKQESSETARRGELKDFILSFLQGLSESTMQAASLR
jgi:hypothetical protein